MSTSTDGKHRKWMQFHLRTMFIGITALSVILYCSLAPFRRKERCLNRLESVGAYISFDYEWTENGAYRPSARPPGNALLQLVLGEHYASNPRDVVMQEAVSPEQITDSDAELIGSLNGLKWLSLQGTNVTDEGLMKLSCLQSLLSPR